MLLVQQCVAPQLLILGHLGEELRQQLGQLLTARLGDLVVDDGRQCDLVELLNGGPQAGASCTSGAMGRTQASAHLHDAVQGVTAKVVVGPHVAVCPSSATCTCEGEGSTAQHVPMFLPKRPRRRVALAANLGVINTKFKVCTIPDSSCLERSLSFVSKEKSVELGSKSARGRAQKLTPAGACGASHARCVPWCFWWQRRPWSKMTQPRQRSEYPT